MDVITLKPGCCLKDLRHFDSTTLRKLTNPIIKFYSVNSDDPREVERVQSGTKLCDGVCVYLSEAPC